MVFVDGGNDRVGISQATPEMTFQIENVGHEYHSVSDDGDPVRSPNRIDINLFTHTAFRSAKILVEIANHDTEIYEIAEILLTTPYKSTSSTIGQEVDLPITIYAVTQSDSTTSVAGTSQGSYAVKGKTDDNIQLQVTPALNSSDITVSAFWQAIAI